MDASMRSLSISEPTFKSADEYLTILGETSYPLGSTCWYIKIEAFGLIRYACGDTKDEAWDKARSLCLFLLIHFFKTDSPGTDFAALARQAIGEAACQNQEVNLGDVTAAYCGWHPLTVGESMTVGYGDGKEYTITRNKDRR